MIIFTWLDTLKIKLHLWVTTQARSKYADWWLVGVAFTESSFFIIPPDVLLIAILMVESERWLMRAALTTVSSVFGGLAGYLIGYAFFDLFGQIIVNAYHLQDELLIVTKLFADNAFWAIFTAAFTPIPYKVFTIAAGLFHLNLTIFVIASILGRGIRFIIVAYLIRRFGPSLGELAYKYFNWLSLAMGVVIIAALAWLAFF